MCMQNIRFQELEWQTGNVGHLQVKSISKETRICIGTCMQEACETAWKGTDVHTQVHTNMHPF